MWRTDCCIPLGFGQDLDKKSQKTNSMLQAVTPNCETETAPSFLDTKKINLVVGALIQKGWPRSAWEDSNLQLAS